MEKKKSSVGILKKKIRWLKCSDIMNMGESIPKLPSALLYNLLKLGAIENIPVSLFKITQ